MRIMCRVTLLLRCEPWKEFPYPGSAAFLVTAFICQKALLILKLTAGEGDKSGSANNKEIQEQFKQAVDEGDHEKACFSLRSMTVHAASDFRVGTSKVLVYL
eukprot:1160520-Pelagomonas_calceolata.AAC.4